MAEDLWKIRERKGMSVTQLSIRAGIPSHVIEDYEAGTPITAAHRAKLAKILYVGESDIKLQSTPRPTKKELKPIESAPPGARPEKAKPPKEPKSAPEPKPAPPAPVRPGQIQFLRDLARHFAMTPEQMEAEIGQPFAELTGQEARQWIKHYQDRITTPSANTPAGYRHTRACLPEAVDQYELRYLTEAQQSGAQLTVKMFNGETFSGTLIGFSTYSMALRLDDNSEVNLQKLAIAYYRRAAGGAA